MDAMITNIRRDAGYYCEKAMAAFENKNFIESIKNLNKAEKVAVGGEKLEIYFIQGLMYNCIEDYDRSSEYFMLSLLSRPLQVKAVRSMFENAITQKDINLAHKYRDLFSYTEADKKEKDAVNKVFELLRNDLKPKIREVRIEDGEEFQKDFEQALDLFEDEQFEESIEILKKYDYKKSQDTRELLADCYFMSERSAEAVEMLTSQDMTVCDKISLLVCLDDLGMENDKKDLIEQIKKSKMTESDLFKFALALLKSNEQMIALDVLERFLKIKPYDKNANNLYCSLCLGLGLFSKAKEKLLQIKEIAQFDSVYYIEMLKMCERKESKRIYDNITLWKSFDRKLKSKLKALLNLEEEEFEKAIIKDEPFINWVATIKDKHSRNLFFIKAAKILGLKDTFQKLFVAEDVDQTLKQIIISTRFDTGYNEEIVMASNGIFVGFIPLAMKYKKNETYYKAFSLVVNRILKENCRIWLYNLNYYFDNLSTFCKADIEDPYVLAAIISWEFESFHKGYTIKEICKYFNVNQQDFWKFYIDNN